MRIISGKYGRRRFQVPTNITARPTTDMARENLFNVLANRIDFESVTALDLFAGTGAVSFELLSRGCPQVTCVEKANTQFQFIRKVQEMVNDRNLHPIRGDVFQYIASAQASFDFIFADPPYTLDRLAELPELILNSQLVHSGTMVVVEHPRQFDFSHIPQFTDHRAYGKVNFSFFTV